VDEDDAVALALLRIGGRDEEADVQAGGGEQGGDGDEHPCTALPGREACQASRIDLERALETLPPRARAVLVLHELEGWKHQEIAEELQMAVGSSKAQLHRARQLLRRALGENA